MNNPTLITLTLSLTLCAPAALAQEPTTPLRVKVGELTPPKNASAPTRTPARAEAAALFAQRCAVCHGAKGAGDGKLAATLRPKPRSFRDPRWQAGATDAHLRKVIVEGGLAVGMSALMPPNPDMNNKPDVVAALVELVRDCRAAGVVRLTLLSAGGDKVATAIAERAEAGDVAHATLSAPAGAYRLQAWFDANEDGKRTKDEPVVEAEVTLPRAEELAVSFATKTTAAPSAADEKKATAPDAARPR
jgi:mono/diheme cytochrome c family protein